MDQDSLPVRRMLVMSPRAYGASSSSPGPVYVDVVISELAIIFFILNLTDPRSVMLWDIAIMAPKIRGKTIRHCSIVHRKLTYPALLVEDIQWLIESSKLCWYRDD